MHNSAERNILFVDDEPRVLRAIKRGLRRHSSEWNMSFAEHAEDALAKLAEHPYDIVVSDITMPKTDGVELLRQVRNQYPDTVRILMSGTAQSDVIMRSVPVAHRFLSKPWDVKALLAELAGAFELRSLMDSVAVRTVVGGISSLPVIPVVYTDLCATLENPTSRLADVVSVVERDPAVVARLLHIVNSAFFAAPRPLHSASDTIRYLGTSLLKSLLLTSEIFSTFDESALPSGCSLAEIQQHALLTAKIASRLATTDKDKALSAGLLHSLGKLIFVDRMPARWGDAFSEARRNKRPLADVEYEHFQTSYAEVGGYLLGIWGLPQDLVEAVAHHCDPMRSRGKGLGLVAVTHLASVLAAQELGKSDEEFDGELLDSLDGARSVEVWRSMTSQLVG
ncbi:MAG: HDOD domain-containing protein [Myxococcales bacterium]|nr:HDOD domain-containing protein [Myxococcales bacterium]